MSSSTTPADLAHAWDPDHYSGFNPKTEEYNYKFLGEKNMLAASMPTHSPELRCPTDGGASACPEAWEMRHMYVVQALPDARADQCARFPHRHLHGFRNVVRAVHRHL